MTDRHEAAIERLYEQLHDHDLLETPDPKWADAGAGVKDGFTHAYEAALVGEGEPSVETWMVDYEHGEGEPQHAVLSWLDDEAKDLPEVGTQLVRKSDYDALKSGPASYEGVVRMLGEVQEERDALRLRARKAEEHLRAALAGQPEVEESAAYKRNIEGVLNLIGLEVIDPSKPITKVNVRAALPDDTTAQRQIEPINQASADDTTPQEEREATSFLREIAARGCRVRHSGRGSGFTCLDRRAEARAAQRDGTQPVIGPFWGSSGEGAKYRDRVAAGEGVCDPCRAQDVLDSARNEEHCEHCGDAIDGDVFERYGCSFCSVKCSGKANPDDYGDPCDEGHWRQQLNTGRVLDSDGERERS